eukprot:gene55278-37153_t
MAAATCAWRVCRRDPTMDVVRHAAFPPLSRLPTACS